MSVVATVGDVVVLGDGEAAFAHRLTLAVDGVDLTVMDRERLLGPDAVGETRAVTLVAFGGTTTECASLDAGVREVGDAVRFEGRVTALDSGHEGFVATLDVGAGTVRFDPGGRPAVRPGDAVRVEPGTVHLLAVETQSVVED